MFQKKVEVKSKDLLPIEKKSKGITYMTTRSHQKSASLWLHLVSRCSSLPLDSRV